MRKLRFHILLLGVFCAPGFISAQNKNRISLQTGLFHCFFDGSPIMNLKYPSNTIKPFNGVLINSVGLNISRKLNQKSALSIEAMYFYESYRKNIIDLKTKEVQERGFMTFSIKYNRLINISSNLNFIYGGGLTFRNGRELVIVNYSAWADGSNEILVEACQRNDIGIKAFTGIEYSPLSWLTLFSNVDFLGFVYLNDKDGRKRLQQDYDIYNFPSRYDLSFNLGIGFNF